MNELNDILYFHKKGKDKAVKMMLDAAAIWQKHRGKIPPNYIYIHKPEPEITGE